MQVRMVTQGNLPRGPGTAAGRHAKILMGTMRPIGWQQQQWRRWDTARASSVVYATAIQASAPWWLNCLDTSANTFVFNQLPVTVTRHSDRDHDPAWLRFKLNGMNRRRLFNQWNAGRCGAIYVTVTVAFAFMRLWWGLIFRNGFRVVPPPPGGRDSSDCAWHSDRDHVGPEHLNHSTGNYPWLSWSRHGHRDGHGLFIKHELQKSSHPGFPPRVQAFTPTCSEAELPEGARHEVLPKPSPPLHVLESGGIMSSRYGFPIIREYRLYHPPTKCHPFLVWHCLHFLWPWPWPALKHPNKAWSVTVTVPWAASK